MASSKQEIVSDITEHMTKEGSAYRFWYVGISQNPRDRLFDDHGVREESDWWIFRWAASSRAAREVEDYFVNQLGTDGGPGGGDVDARGVYGYRKQRHTDP